MPTQQDDMNPILKAFGFRKDPPLPPAQQAQWEAIKQNAADVPRLLNPTRSGLRGTTQGVTPAATDVAVQPMVNAPPQTARMPRGGAASVLSPQDVAIAPTTQINPSTRFGLRQTGSTYTLGTPGQDGYGRMIVTQAPAQQAVSPDSPVSMARGGFSFQGSAADAGRFFSTGGDTSQQGTPGSAEYNTYRAVNFQKANPFATVNPFDQRFAYVPPEETSVPAIPAPPVYGAGGGGWQSQARAYEADVSRYNAELSAYNAALGLRQKARTSVGAQETEAQAGLRQAQTIKELAQTELYRAQTGEVGKAKQEKPVLQMRKIINPDGSVTETPVMLSPGGYTELPNVTPGAAEQVKRTAFAAQYAKTPEQQRRWSALTPEEQDAIIMQEAAAGR